MPSRQRYVVLGIVAIAIIVGLALGHGFQWVWSEFGLNDPRPLGLRELPLTTLLGYAVAFAAAGFVLKHEPSRVVAGEIVDELGRVTWPSREETGHATWVVIVTVLVCSAYLGVFDAFWLWVTDLILGVQVSTPG
jgi:preprotein translocase SecE subunit